jgi:hypothetical protein
MANDCWYKEESKPNEASLMHENKNDDSNQDEAVLLVCQGEELNGIWYVDSAASKHMTGDKMMFTNLLESDYGQVKVGDGKTYEIKGVGDVQFKTKSNKIEKIGEVYYVPGLKNNLLSVGHLLRKGYEVNFRDKSCYLLKQNQLVVKINVAPNNLFPLNLRTPNLACLANVDKETSKLWHRRFGHLNYGSLELLSRKTVVKGLPQIKNVEEICAECQLGKKHRDPFPSRTWNAKKPLELVHSDLCGPMSETSLGGSSYFISFIDDYSRKCWVYFLKEKSEAFNVFKEFKAEVERYSGSLIKTLRTDRGGEYLSNEFEQYCKHVGIRHELTVRYTPQQNGVCERKNRTIVEMARCMLKEKNLPRKFWAEAVSCAVYILNRSPTKSLMNITPHEAWYGSKPDVSHLKVFGSIAYALVPGEIRRKLDDKAEKCIFIGYGERSKAYKLFNPKTEKIVIRDVRFDEVSLFDAKESVTTSEPLSSNEEEDVEVESESEDISKSPSPKKMRSLQDIYDATEQIEQSDVVYFAFFAGEDPISFDEACKEEKWMEAMNEEMQAIKKNDTWKLTSLPPHKEPIGVKWVYKTKKNPDGSVNKYKARLVAKGYKQKEGEDYTEVFAPVSRLDTVRLIISLAAQNSWRIFQMDVKSAFLNGVLQEDVYLEQPPGFVKKGEEKKVYKLKKALYGLKQSPRAWYSRINSYFEKNGFQKCPYEHTLYTKSNSRGSFMVISLYVDDLVFTGNDLEMLHEFKLSMMKEFEMTDMGELHHFLGIEVTQSNKGVFISQESYAKEILKKFNMADCNPVSTPCITGLKLSKVGEGKLVNSTMYRSLVGNLMYLTATRPDLAYAISLVSRFMENPHSNHWEAAKRILRYVKGTLDSGIFYEANVVVNLMGYTDSDLAGSADDSKSTSGYVFNLGSGSISWSSKKQSIVALSTTEAEYIVASSAGCQIIWLRGILESLKHKQCGPTKLFCDNKSTISVIKDPVLHGRTKHIRMRFHFLRELVNEEVINVEYCKTDDQMANMFTKPVGGVCFKRDASRLGMRSKFGLREALLGK